jgi:hypothetical protein
MKEILLDVHIAEAYSSLVCKDSIANRTFNKNIDSLSIFYKLILDKHHVSITQLEEAMKWYGLHPQELDSVYSNIMPVLDSLKGVPSIIVHPLQAKDAR